MTTIHRVLLCIPLLLLAYEGFAQDILVAATSDNEELKLSAMEALMSAPEERAFPIVSKVLAGNGSDELKKRALFVLSQMSLPEAQSLLFGTARNGSEALRMEAVRMMGINGDPQLMAGLADIYRSGDAGVREAVLEAYLIADDADGVLRIANSATTTEEFQAAVDALGAMGAVEELRSLRGKDGMSEILINAYAIAGDVETLRTLATDNSDPQRQKKAIRGLAVTGDDNVNAVFMQIYRDAGDSEIRDAALEAMMISDYDQGVIELFQSSKDAAEKRKLLQLLVAMDSDAVWDVIDQTLEKNR